MVFRPVAIATVSPTDHERRWSVQVRPTFAAFPLHLMLRQREVLIRPDQAGHHHLFLNRILQNLDIAHRLTSRRRPPQ